jgi:superfamily II DNA or RNA helicase
MEIALTHKGYSIPKSRLNELETKKMIEELTVCPKVNAKFMTPAQKAQLTYKVYRESPNRWYLPRAYGVKTFGAIESDVVSEGLPLSPSAADFKGVPYPYQTDIIQSFMNAGANGLICVPCGKGKTFMAIKIASEVGKRFLVIVDKEFLMNQWRGELESLLPGLRIGILQGPKSETNPDEYDCTICMIQTLCNRDFDDSIFKNYGFAIFDECHHLGAQHFSKTLQKVQVKHMLGLSATMNRKDGTTHVFKMFLGNVIYKGERDEKHDVEVRAIQYSNNDDEFNKVIHDYRGNVQYSTMISKLCEFNHRTEFILKILIDILHENPSQQIMMIAHNKNVLKYLHELKKN